LKTKRARNAAWMELQTKEARGDAGSGGPVDEKAVCQGKLFRTEGN